MKLNINPIYLKDYYKHSHHRQYPAGTTLLFSNWTARKSRLPGVNHSVFFGLQYFLRYYLQLQFENRFFLKDFSSKQVAMRYQKFFECTLGDTSYPEHIEQLHGLGYLPIAIYALPELSVVPCGVPSLVMFNTHPEFAWVPGMLETLLSCTLWPACNSATIAREYRLLLDQFAEETSDQPEFVDYQAHDFSMRGMMGVESACISGMAHLQYFKGTDTIPAMMYNEVYNHQPLHICSVPATEHSVMCAYGKEHEYEAFERLITEIYPNGIVSIVSDTWDLWRVVSDYLPRLRERVLNRDGRVVIRPDSGDPVEIICGDGVNNGVIDYLWNVFGGKVNAKGYKQLDPHVGIIYGDSITLDRCRSICERLKEKGFASTNVVFGVGSYTYQYNTRDTLGFAMKATYAEINGEPRILQKDPITDNGTKKSHAGLLKVVRTQTPDHSFMVLEHQDWDSFYAEDNELKLAYYEGKIY